MKLEIGIEIRNEGPVDVLWHAGVYRIVFVLFVLFCLLLVKEYFDLFAHLFGALTNLRVCMFGFVILVIVITIIIN